MKSLKYILIVTISCCFAPSYGQQDLSLSDAISFGLKNNYGLRIETQKEKIAATNNHWGNAGALPSVNFTTNARENFNINDNDNYRSQTITPEVSLNWTIFNGFSAKISKQRLGELEKQSAGNTAVLVESTIQDIILAYNTCLLQNELLDVYKALNKLSEDRYQRTNDSKELGATTTYETLQAKTAWLEDQSNFLRQKVTFENAVRSLNFILGIEDNVSWNFTSKLDMSKQDYSLENLKLRLLENNQTLKNQYINQSLLAKETELAKARMYPKLSMNTGVRNNQLNNYYSGSTPNMGQNTTDAYVGLTLSFNIFNGGTTKRSIEIARINEQTAEIQTTQMQHSLNNQLLQTYSNYNVQKALLELANEKEAAARLNLELSSEKLKTGAINSFNYRDVQIAFMNAAVARYQAIFNLIESDTELLRISGGIVNEYQ